jgi:hypothetical protein
MLIGSCVDCPIVFNDVAARTERDFADLTTAGAVIVQLAS